MFTTRRILMFVLMLLPTVAAVASQRGYATSRLQKIASALPHTTLAMIPQNDTTAVIDTPSGRLKARVAGDTVVFLGVALFDSNGMPRHVADRLEFVERLALEYRLFRDETQSLMKTAGIEFENTTPGKIESARGSLTDAVNLVDTDHRRCRLSWRKPDGTTAAAVFPNYHDLIAGRSMGENEQLLERGLTSRRDTVLPAGNVDPESLVRPWPPKMLVARGDTLESRALSADRYYSLKTRGGRHQLICSSLFPVESLANLFTTAQIANDISVDIRMKCYGFTDRLFKVSLNAFVSYFIENGCKMYFGLQSIDNDEAVFTLIAQNEPDGYCHTMSVKAPLDIVTQRRGHVSLRMNNFIPISKIDRLYDEKTKR